MIIRPATARDIPTILLLEQNAENAAHWPAERYAEAIGVEDSRRLILVVEDIEIRGLGVVHRIGPEWEIENIVVSSSFRRKGIAFSLLREFFSLARQMGAQWLFLEVRESNLAARALYEKCGFAQAGERRGYYSRPRESAILYRYQPEA